LGLTQFRTGDLSAARKNWAAQLRDHPNGPLAERTRSLLSQVSTSGK